MRTEFSAATGIRRSPSFFSWRPPTRGPPECSFKGGMPGFIQVIGQSELAFPDYDGNGMFKSLGNVAVNPNVGLLFVRCTASRNGWASTAPHGPARRSADRVGRRSADDRTGHGGGDLSQLPALHSAMQPVEPSVYAPRPGVPPVEPAWKGFDDFKGYVHPRQPTAKGTAKSDVDKDG